MQQGQWRHQRMRSGVGKVSKAMARAGGRNDVCATAVIPDSGAAAAAPGAGDLDVASVPMEKS